MDHDPTSLDHHRGAAGRRATELRRLHARIEADQAAVRASRSELEVLLATTPAETLGDALETARYLLELFAGGASAAEPSRRRLIARTLIDLDRLAGDGGSDAGSDLGEKRAVGRGGRGGSGRRVAKPAGERPPPAAQRDVVTSMASHRGPRHPNEPPSDGAPAPRAPGDDRDA
ncbi:hypothetical protein ACTZWW_04790 [Salinarimonas sp. NSM]|uniref:hypothetical protein n=1 Tax=Salinarimonas sp. NSM TaxID=3458003 RepID=UPI004035A9DD